MTFKFSPKASDVYQVTKAPTNKNDVILSAVGMGVSGLMVLGFIGLAAYAIYQCRPIKREKEN